MYRFFRPLLFRLDPEEAHHLTLRLVGFAGRFPPARLLLEACFAAPARPVSVFGLNFRNPVGLAAGYDKEAAAVRGLAALGFGHLELGTVTLRPQAGNPKPRVFRLVQDEAVINRMGFPGRGAQAAQTAMEGLRRRRTEMSGRGTQLPVIGVNIGKNKDTPLEEAPQEYAALLGTFAPLADYLAVNVSSPNTAGLRRLQGRALLEGLLGALREKRATLETDRPLLVKLAPDLDDAELEDALAAITGTGMDGVIATNTTLGREGLRSPLREESGGLSGRPLTEMSAAFLEKVVRRLDGRLPVVSAGGIMTPEEARRRLEMGAALVQVYTGLIYAGPGLVRRIVRSLPER